MKWFRRKPMLSPEAEYIEKLNQEAKVRELMWTPSIAPGILYLPQNMNRIDASTIMTSFIDADKLNAGRITAATIKPGLYKP